MLIAGSAPLGGTVVILGRVFNIGCDKVRY